MYSASNLTLSIHFGRKTQQFINFALKTQQKSEIGGIDFQNPKEIYIKILILFRYTERFQNNLVSAISKIFGDVPEINDIKNLVIDKEEEIWSQMSKSTGKTEKEIAQFYFQTDEFKATHSYKLSQEDKTRIIQINNKYPEMKPNKIIDQFLNERTSNYKIARKNAVMFVVHNRLRQKNE
ncbi:Hypothetical_protein [Hexamita inflata]|uniref:Hypothetical_protein n=1 Tax=Hexamita inflata TaxID=28002 RepID=A0AA86RXK8_9EUKA|nr:Hypothetical protein HINF_LOCUS62050 [Hexamita inflata]